MRPLAVESLIRLDARRGAVARDTDLDEVREIYLLRWLTEPEAVRITMWAAASDEDGGVTVAGDGL